MSSHRPTQAIVHSGESRRVARSAWLLANAVGLGTTFALFAAVGEGMEATGAEHDTVGWGVPTLLAMIVGGSLFAYLRQRVLGGPVRWSQTLVIGIAVTAGFVAGWIPPLDFIAGIFVAGVVGAALQLREVGAPGRRWLMVSVATWLVAGVTAVAAAIVTAEVIISGALNRSDLVDGVGGFAAILALAGAVGGAVGGAIEGRTTLRRLARSRSTL